MGKRIEPKPEEEFKRNMAKLEEKVYAGMMLPSRTIKREQDTTRRSSDT